MKKKNVVQGKHYRFTLITEKLIRLEYSESDYFEDGPTQIVLNRDFGPVEYNVIEDDNRLEIITEAFHLYYNKGTFSTSNLFIDVRYNFSVYGNRWYYGSRIETLKGTARTLDEANGAIELGEGIISKNGFAVLDDSNSFILDEQQVPKPRKAEETDIYFFAYGRDYLKAVKDFYRLTGATPLLPRYALGNWWSRYWRYDEKEYLELMERFKKEEIPLSVSVIDMDWHLVDVPKRFGSGWTGYTWNRELFPEPKRFLKKLHEMGLRVTLNVHPADGIRAFEEAYPRVAKRLGLNQELEEPAKFDISNETFRKSYFEDVHHPLEDEGVDFWWLDWQQGTESGEKGLDPLWLLNHYHYLDVQRKGNNDVILSRYAGPGSHRYPIGFSGDTIISWESLDFQPYFTSTASNIGYSWWSHDIGGHMNGCRDEELSLRWLQLGVFSPINRLHSSASPFTGKEPWRYGKEVYEAMKDYFRLRHALIPYLYTMNVKTHEEGLPLIKPMYYGYPLHEEAYQVPNQYFYGTELMVCPITKKSDDVLKTGAVQVWLPEGNWYDFFNGTRYKGGTKLEIFRTQDVIPVFAKEGAIIPMDDEPAKTTGNQLPETIRWNIFPGADNQFEMIEEINNQKVITAVNWNWQEKVLTLSYSGEPSIFLNNRKHKFVMYGVQTADVECENGHVKNITHSQNRVVFELGAVNGGSSIVTFRCLETVEKQDIFPEMFRRLERAYLLNNLKDYLWRVLGDKKETLPRMSILHDIENERLRKSLFELFYVQES